MDNRVPDEGVFGSAKFGWREVDVSVARGLALEKEVDAISRLVISLET
jgi:hypothetical protein